MSYLLAGLPLHKGVIHQPAQGTWTADLEVIAEVALSGTLDLELPGLTLTGTVVGGGVSEARQKVRLVGGMGGLRKTVQGQHFNRAAVRTAVQHLLNAVGERLAPDSDPAILNRILGHWQHQRGTAGQGLDQLATHLGTTWWVTPAGEVRIGDHAWKEVEPDHVLVAEDLVAQSRTIASLDDTVQPGTVFLGERVTTVEHTFNPQRTRTIVRWGGTSGLHPTDEALRDVVRALQLRTLPAYGAEVVVQHADGSLDLKPTSDKIGPGWMHVPLYLVGTATVKVQPGARCLVEFIDNDISQPFVRSFLAGAFTEIKESATAKIEQRAPVLDIGDAGASITLAGSAKPVVRVGDVVAGLISGLPAAPVTGTYGATPPLSTVKA